MKKLLTAAALSVVALASMPVHAQQSVSGGFNVVINLAATCQIRTPSIADLTLAYTSFQTAATTATTNFNLRCTQSLPYTISLQSASATAGAGFGAQTAGTNTALPYTLAINNNSGTGTGLTEINHIITGTIAGGLSGTCATANCSDTIARTVFVNY